MIEELGALGDARWSCVARRSVVAHFAIRATGVRDSGRDVGSALPCVGTL